MINNDELLVYNSDIYEVEENKDPYEKMNFISRLAMDDSPELRRFEIPTDNPQGLCLNKCMISASFVIPSNYVPDNDILAKGISKLDMSIQNTKMFSSHDESAYSFYSHSYTKLNKSFQSQEIDMFSSGRYDAYDVDSSQLNDIRLHHNNLNLVENRQQYAKAIWKFGGSIHTKTKNSSPLSIPFARLFHEYNVRAPFMHGLAGQQRLIPPGVKMKLEFTMNEQGYCFLRHSKYQICRASKKLLKKMSFPFPPGMFTEEMSAESHTKVGDCDCEAKLETGEYTRLEEIHEEGKVLLKDKGADLYKKLISKTDFRQHQVYKDVPALTPIPHEDKKSEDDQDIYFAYEKNLNPTDKFNPNKFVFESVFKDPENDQEKPISNGKKSESFIPFYSPQFKRIELQAGRQEYERELSSGLLPKAIIISGMPFSRKSSNFEISSTKSRLDWNGFKIKELTILINDQPAFRSPFTDARQHYVNFLQQSGNYDNKLSTGMDFFVFCNQNWMIPLRFDDTTGDSFTVKIRIKFDHVIDENFDLISLCLPYKELLLNGDTHGKKYVNVWEYDFF